MTIQVALIEDHELVRTGLKLLIERQKDLQVVGEAADGAEGLKIIARTLPDVVVLDLSIPHLNGFELLEQLQHQKRPPKVLVVTANEDLDSLQRSWNLGASGHLPKRSAADELIVAIRKIAAGEKVFSLKEESKAVKTLGFNETSGRLTGAESLSERETEVLKLIAAGHMAKEIAAKLDISLKTVETYKSRGMQKLSLRGRTELVRFAMKMGWLNDTP